jgi:glycosyltransferase involved in cell wall biosynthesis
MVTLDRINLLKQSVNRFCLQTYPHKELIIVTDGSEEYRQQIIQFVAGLNHPAIKVIPVEQKQKLGALRNIAMSQASGEILCQWDDDDLYHPQRLEMQLLCLQYMDASACFMADYFHYFVERKELLWCTCARSGGFPGSIMFKAGLGLSYPETGPQSEKGEDEVFQRELAKRYKTALLRECGYLYVYAFHGRNTWDLNHHSRLAKLLALPFDFVRPRLGPLYRQLKAQLGQEFPVTLVWRNGERVEFRPPQNAASPQ